MILFLGNIKIRAHKSQSTKFTSHCGKEWVYSHIWIDGEKIECWHDIKYGMSIYFKLLNECRYIKMTSEFGAPEKYSLNPFEEKIELTTQLQ